MNTGNDEVPPAGAVIGECDWCHLDIYEGQEYEEGNGGVGIMHVTCYAEKEDNTEPPERDTYGDNVNDGRSMPKRDENNP